MKKLTAMLVTGNYANTDYDDIRDRAPILRLITLDIKSAAIAARNFAMSWKRGSTKITHLLCVETGSWFHVSQNGKFWRGTVQDWIPGMQPLTLSDVIKG